MKIQLLIDNPTSWIVPYANTLNNSLEALGHHSKVIFDPLEVEAGDVLCLLSCEKIFTGLSLNKHNLVVHESALPKGKGWSPLTWQILENKNAIPVTLFEASDKVDSGLIYYQEFMALDGSELIDELRNLQGELTNKLILQFVSNYSRIQGTEQTGESTYYPKRTAADSKLDVDKTIREQFNQLRVADNLRYPSFFEHQGTKYKLTIEKLD